jgi:hypothetical protein
MPRWPKLLGAALAVSVLALVAGIGTGRAQAPTPRAPSIVQSGPGEASLEWIAPTEYATGGSLADPSGLTFVVEAMAPGATEWTAIGTTAGTTYRVTGLRAGVWRFRVRGRIHGGPLGDPSPEGSKSIAEL